MPSTLTRITGEFELEVPSEFDRNGNGVIDAAEWEAMHAQALRLAKEKQAELLAAPTVHRVMKPDRRFHYLISSRDPAALAGHYRLWRSTGLTLFLGAGAAAVWVFSLGIPILKF